MYQKMRFYLAFRVLTENENKYIPTQQMITCSKTAIEVLEKGFWNKFNVYHKDTRATLLTSFSCLYC